jgi:hypothetical protein
MKKTFVLLAGIFLAGVSALAQHAFVSPGSEWRYLADGTDQSIAAHDFFRDDSSWSRGLAQLGYGDGDEVTVVPYGPDPNNKYITTYFRRSFWVTNAAQVTNLVLRLLIDDGAVAYINGVEVARVNMPAGPVTYTTLATLAAENTWTEHTLSPGAIMTGQNLLSVEVHQANANTSDMSFDAGLTGTESPGPTRPTITRHPESQTVPAGSDVTFTVEATGTPPLTYRWRRNSLTIIGATNSTLTLFNVQTGGVFSVVVGNAAGSVLSSNAVLTVTSSPPTNTPPTVAIVAPTNGARFPVGADIFLDATASDSDGTVTHVEFFAGTNKIADASPGIDSYIAVWSNAPAGTHQLRAFATDNNNNRGTSPLIVIRVGDPPMITRQPQSQTVTEGSDVTFTVEATGTPPLTYRWRRNSVFLPGATNSTLTLFSVTSSNAGNYSVIVANSVGSTVSLPAMLTVNPTNFRPTVAISAPTNGTRFAEGQPIPIEANAADSDGFIDRVEFYVGTNKLAEDFTAPFQFTWEGAPAGQHQLRAQAFDNVQASTMSAPVEVIVGSSGGNVVLLPRGGVWRYLDDGSDQGTAWTQRFFTNEIGWASGPAQLGFGDGDEATVLRSGHITYYFRKSLNLSNASAFSNIELHMLRDDGAVVYINGTEVARQNMPAGPVTYQTFAAAVEFDENAFHRSPVPPGVLINGLNIIAVEVHQVAFSSSDVSFDFELRADSSVPVPPNIITHPRSQTAVAGSTVTFRVEAGGTQPLSYRWRRNGIFLDTATNSNLMLLNGATNATLTILNVETNASGFYNVLVSNSAGSRLSATATLTVIRTNRPPTAQSQPIFPLEDTPHSFTLSASDPDGDPLTFLITVPPAHGTLSGTGPDFTYTPDPNYNGSDSFTFRVSDGELQSAPATVSISVASVNDAPVAQLRVVNSLIFLEDLTVIILNATDPFTLDGTQSFDVDGGSLQYRWALGDPPQPLGPNPNPIVSLRFGPGTHLFHLTVSDGSESDTASVQFNVLTPCDAINLLIIEVNDASLRRQAKRVLTQALRMACEAFDQGDIDRGIDRLEQFQHKVAVQVGDSDPALAGRLTEAAGTLIGALTQQ